MMSKTCKQACRWGIPARIFDGPVLHKVGDVEKALKHAPKGSPERDRLQRLLDTQQRLCWSCGKRCSEGEAAQLSHEAKGASLMGLKV
jgi:hypothetical protein